MSGWIIHLFASEQLDQIFWIATLMTMPFWLLMLLFPDSRLTRSLCQPLRAPVVYVFLWMYLLYEFFAVGLPSHSGGLGYEGFSAWVGHPLLLLLLWVQVQIMNLIIGTVLYSSSLHGAQARLWPEMLATWAFGPLGLVVYWLRLCLRFIMLRFGN